MKKGGGPARGDEETCRREGGGPAEGEKEGLQKGSSRKACRSGGEGPAGGETGVEEKCLHGGDEEGLQEAGN